MFSPLQVISSYSLLQSPLKLENYVTHAKKLGYTALALTDINVMYGVLDFYQLCLKNDIKPLIGLVLELNGKDEPSRPLILFAQNNQGYADLMQISTAKMAVAGAEAGTAPLDLATVSALLQNMIAIIPTFSPLKKGLTDHDYGYAKEYLNQFLSYFDQRHLFLGVDPSLNDDVIYGLRLLQHQFNLRLIAAPLVKYLTASDKFNEEVLHAIKKGQPLTPSQLAHPAQGKAYLKAPETYAHDFKEEGLSDAYENAQQMIKNINVKLDFPPTHLPQFTTPKGKTSQQYLHDLCYQGLKRRLVTVDATKYSQYYQRLDHELEVIHRMGFDDYFLIVWDVTNFSHTHNILVGPGRGSAAGSLVSYTLFITDVDPLKYDLLFERFLNEERAQMPDIDLDIPDQKRDQVIQYVHDHYGQTHMAQIITYAHLNARQVIHDVSRAMGQNSYETTQWSDSMPHKLGLTLDEAYNDSQDLCDLVVDSQKNNLIFKTAKALEGLPRQYSTHAAGVILSDHDLRHYVPLQIGSEGIYLTQFAKEQVEKIGLLKIDFLGLRNLTILENALYFIKKNYDPTFDIHQIALNDPQTIALFQKADTTGIFQFESPGIKKVLRQLHPQTFEDIVSTNALYRPGPIKNINEFIARKNGQKEITYPNEQLRPILAKTYGIMVYQEQVMQVASKMGGFTLGEADLLRRAMSKKKQNVIDQMRTKFIQGALQKGYSEKEAIQVYQFIEHFGNYGFNRSHAVAYSKLAFELAYIKSHYPGAFYAALLNAVVGGSTKTRDYINEAHRRGVKVHVPDINQSNANFNLKGKVIFFGLRSIRKLRTDFIKAILTERRAHGSYHSVTDFIERLDNKFLTKDALDSLIYAGTFDSLEKDRNKLLAEMPGLLDSIKLSSGSPDLLKQLMPKTNLTGPHLSLNELLQKEAEYLGTYVSAHPVDAYHKLAEIYHAVPLVQVRPRQSNINVVAAIKKVSEVTTRNQTKMAFVTLSDQSGELEMTVFPQQYIKYSSLLRENNIILATGHPQIYNDRLGLVAQNIQLAADVSLQCYYLRIYKLDQKVKNELLQLMARHHGKTPVILYESSTNRKISMDQHYWMNADQATQSALIAFLGAPNVKLK